MSDYTISWGYIVSRMESLFGLKPDDEERFWFIEIERHVAYIWQEYFEMKYREEFCERSEE